jgi:glycosyltransferase involved in cell wall biosynthesis
MRIRYSHHIFSNQSVGGISNYFIDLVEGLSSFNLDIEMNFPLAVTQALKHRHNFRGKVIPENLIYRGITWRFCHLINNSFETTGAYLLSRNDLQDVYHRTYYSDSGNKQGVPEVLTVYDMIHEDYPQFFRRPIFKEKVLSINRASAIICISQYTRERLINHVDVDPQKITVIPLGVAQQINPTRSTRPTRQRPFILYVGRRDGYKNFSVLEKAFSLLTEVFKDLDLVLVGGGNLTDVELTRFKVLGITNNVRLAPINSNLDSLFKEADCVVSTSLSEGFGLVPLEAASMGTPSVVSDIEVNREIWGDKLPMFPPMDDGALANQLKKVLESDVHWEKVSQDGLSIARNLSVQNMAQATIDVYQNVAMGGK